MAIEDRRARERAARRRLITATARKLAEEEGWDAVTTRRLSAEIEYSQPVLYKHFAGMEGIVASVAVQGFAELGEALAAARAGATDGRAALTRVAHAFIGFARDNPALFDAMFIRATTLPFAADDTPAELNDAFDELRAAVDMVAGARDPDTLAEVVWAALHGLITLDRGGRLRPDYRDARIDILVSGVCGEYVSLVTRRHNDGRSGVLRAAHPREQETPMTAQRTHIVVIGGGYAGTLAANHLRLRRRRRHHRGEPAAGVRRADPVCIRWWPAAATRPSTTGLCSARVSGWWSTTPTGSTPPPAPSS